MAAIEGYLWMTNSAGEQEHAAIYDSVGVGDTFVQKFFPVSVGGITGYVKLGLLTNPLATSGRMLIDGETWAICSRDSDSSSSGGSGGSGDGGTVTSTRDYGEYVSSGNEGSAAGVFSYVGEEDCDKLGESCPAVAWEWEDDEKEAGTWVWNPEACIYCGECLKTGCVEWNLIPPE